MLEVHINQNRKQKHQHSYGLSILRIIASVFRFSFGIKELGIIGIEGLLRNSYTFDRKITYFESDLGLKIVLKLLFCIKRNDYCCLFNWKSIYAYCLKGLSKSIEGCSLRNDAFTGELFGHFTYTSKYIPQIRSQTNSLVWTAVYFEYIWYIWSQIY